MGSCLCFTWLSHFWSHSMSSSTSQEMASLDSLPDDVMTDVLSRLPADVVVNLRRVCRRWCSLIATPNFVELHLQRSSPVMIFQTWSPDHVVNEKFSLFFVDWRSKKKKQLIREIRSKKIESVPSKEFLRFRGSCNGLFIFMIMATCPLSYYIFNPITQERITVQQGLIVGFFFNSLTKKYQLLNLDNSSDNFRFYIGTLDIGTLRPIMWREVGSFPYGPREVFIPPSVVNGCLHWMVIGKRGKKDILPPCIHSLMVFSIEDCEFRFLPHPKKVHQSCQGHQNMHLLAIRGKLYAYGMYAKMLDIWVLEDSANWYWVKKFNIHLERDLKQYSIDDIAIMSYKTHFRMTLIDIWKDEVLLIVPKKGFFRYNTRMKTITRAQFAHSSCVSKLCEVIALECKMSLLSLGDFFDASSETQSCVTH